MRIHYRQRRRHRRGITAMETALVMIPFLTFLIGTFEYCRYMMMLNLAENACREGARYAVVHTYDKTTSDIQAVVMAKLAGLQNNIESLSIDVYEADPATGTNLGAWTDAKFGEGIAVTISGSYRPVAPTILRMSSTLPFTRKVIMLSEAN